MEALDDSYLARFGAISKLKKVVVVECPQVTMEGLSHLLLKKPDLVLTLGECKQIGRQGYSTLTGRYRLSLHFRSGRIFDVSDSTLLQLLDQAIEETNQEIFFFALSQGLKLSAGDQEKWMFLYRVFKRKSRDTTETNQMLLALVFVGIDPSVKNRKNESVLNLILRLSNTPIQSEASYFKACHDYLKKLEEPNFVLSEIVKINSHWTSPVAFWFALRLFIQKNNQIHPLNLLDQLFHDQSNLDFNDQKIGDANVQILALALQGSKAEALHLRNNRMGVDGVKALAVALQKSRITQLTLGDNDLRQEGISAITGILPDSKIKELYLFNTFLNENAVSKENALGDIAKHLPNSKVSVLDLGDNRMRDSGVIKLKEALIKPNMIEKLYLYNNDITSIGARELGSVLDKTQITFLDLGGNQIDQDGIKALEDAKNRSPSLTIRYNKPDE